MYVYNISSYFQNNQSEYNDDQEYIVEYLMHEDAKFSPAQFNEICNKVLSYCKHKEIFELKEKLKEYYDFKELTFTASFEFEEES